LLTAILIYFHAVHPELDDLLRLFSKLAAQFLQGATAKQMAQRKAKEDVPQSFLCFRPRAGVK
jgi:hypothetical protein